MAVKVNISVHDLPFEIYSKLGVKEEVGQDNTTRWKTIKTDSSNITYFRREEAK